MSARVLVNLDELAKRLDLTEKQRLFADAYVFLTGLDGVAAAKFAGYKCDYPTNYPEDKKKYYETLAYQGRARENLNNPKVLEYISTIRDNLDKQLVVDKLWVVNKLKNLAEQGTEATQLKATEMIGKILGMFIDHQKIEVTDEDPAVIARKAIEIRRSQINEEKKNNIVEFSKDGTDAN